MEDTWDAIRGLLKLDLVMLIANIVLSAAAMVLGGSLLCRLPVHPLSAGGKAISAQNNIPYSQTSLAVFTCLTAPFSLLLNGRSYTSLFQLLAYIIIIHSIGRTASVNQTDIDRESNKTKQTKDSNAPPQRVLHSRGSWGVDGNAGLSRTGGTKFSDSTINLGGITAQVLTGAVVVLAAICVLPWFASNFGLISGPEVPINPPAHLDLEYQPQFDIDIVVSMYKEPVDRLDSVLKSILQLPAFQGKSQRLIIYTKDEQADVPFIKQATHAFHVVQLPNIGREGETFLRHIITQWDNLAAHTMFIQGGIHNPREFVPRVRDYFDPRSTGMLSLGFSGNVCDSEDCGDRFGWRDDTKLVPSLYMKAYHTEKIYSRTLLNYKGQFIASARRIRGVRKAIYQDLWDTLKNPDSWVHRKEFLRDQKDGEKDEMSAPIFGYTLERVWGVLMQCSDLEIAWKCPTLLSGRRRGGSKRDCQCFDELQKKT